MLWLRRDTGVDLLKEISERICVTFSSLRARTVEVVENAGANDEDGSLGSTSVAVAVAYLVPRLEAPDSAVPSSREERIVGTSVCGFTCASDNRRVGTGNGVTV